MYIETDSKTTHHERSRNPKCNVSLLSLSRDVSKLASPLQHTFNDTS